MSRVAVLKGGRSLERQVSLRSGARVQDALERLGHEVLPIDVGPDLVGALSAERPEVAFVALHGRDGEDGTVQELLEVMGIPYTGSGVSACIRAADKVLAKHAMRDRGVPTPDFYAFNETAFEALGAAQALPAIEERLEFPIVVKPARQGSALGIKFARTPADVPAALVAAFSYDRKVLLERYVARARARGLDPGGRPTAPSRCRSSRPCPSRRTSTTSSRATRSVVPASCARPSWTPTIAERAPRDRARNLRAAGLRRLRARRPDARRGRRRALRARAQPDPRADRDQPAPPGRRGGGHLVRRARRAGARRRACSVRAPTTPACRSRGATRRWRSPRG